jgi:hypothetical protein
MLYACSNRKHSAIGIFGDYYDLKGVHTFVGDIASGNALPEQMREFLWSFAFDLRKAYEGSREVKKLGFDGLDKATYRGVYVYWPYFIAYLKLLRQASARRPTSRLEQATLWTLEGLCETTLSKHAPEAAKRVLHWLDHSFSFNESYINEWLIVCCRKYVEEARGKKRLAGLVTFVSRVSPISREYQGFHSLMEEEAKRQQCPVSSLEDQTPWPEGEEL